MRVIVQLTSHAAARWCAGLCAAALIAGVLSLGATPLAAGAVSYGWDKLAHAALHFVLSLSLLVALRPSRMPWVLFVCLAFATTDEVAQLFYPGRTASLFDWGADALGMALGIGCVRVGREYSMPRPA